MILDGKRVSQQIIEAIKKEVKACTPRPPCLVALITTDHPASHTYVSKKAAACREVGITSKVHHIRPKNTEELLEAIDALNMDPTVDGILVQLPLPPTISVALILERIDPKKDVDGFHPVNMGKLLLGERDGFIPCTPLGIQVLLQEHQIDVAGKRVVIVGRSNIVGKPLAALLMQNAPGGNATVTVAHSQTPNLKEVCLSADILVAAVGKPKVITKEMCREGVCIVDVGVNKIEGTSKLVGDVDFENVFPHVSAITPVPGGVGPMTIAMLLTNTLKAFRHKKEG